MKRREFFVHSAQVAGALGLAGLAANQLFGCAQEKEAPLFKISLAEWSLHKALFSKQMDHLDFAVSARRDYGIAGAEYVNQFFMDKAKDMAYLKEMKNRAEGEGVRSLLIMCDGEGRLGDPDDAKRTETVENHYKWVDAAAFLGCHSIRVNAASEGTYEEQMKLAADGLRRLTEYGAKNGLNVIVENHGGISSNGEWLSGVIKAVGNARSGTLPDFGNFHIQGDEWYDRYKGVKELMPFAKAVSAKSFDFDENGNETTIDFFKMLKIVVDAGYHEYLGIEYEGDRLSEPEGIRATKKLLERVREDLQKA